MEINAAIEKPQWKHLSGNGKPPSGFFHIIFSLYAIYPVKKLIH
jgi:hypothetical protein